MNTPHLSLEDVIQMTEAYGAGWALAHARALAQVRLERMEQCLRWLEEEGLGTL